jgi:hypothetical protein
LLLLANELAALATTDVCWNPGSPTGSGSGADWNNMKALTSSSTYTRDTINYVADGSIATGWTLATAVSGTQRVTFRKATDLDHGPATGWVSTMGDGQFQWTGELLIRSSYITVDGITGGGPGSWTTGFGFRGAQNVINQNVTIASGTGSSDAQITDIIVSHVDFAGHGPDGDVHAGNNDIVWLYGANITISYCKIDNAGRCLIFCNRNSDHIKFNYDWFGTHESNTDEHSEIASVSNDYDLQNSTGQSLSDWQYNYCVFTHSEGTGGLMYAGDDETIEGCIFNGSGLGGGNGVVGTWDASQATNVKLYNSTFYNCSANCFGILNVGTPGDTLTAKNNLFKNVTLGSLPTTHTHNHYDNVSDEPSEATKSTGTITFTDAANLNFMTTANTTAGTDLGSPYNVDLNGNTRTTWTRGAFEYQSGGGTSGGGASVKAKRSVRRR